MNTQGGDGIAGGSGDLQHLAVASAGHRAEISPRRCPIDRLDGCDRRIGRCLQAQPHARQPARPAQNILERHALVAADQRRSFQFALGRDVIVAGERRPGRLGRRVADADLSHGRHTIQCAIVKVCELADHSLSLAATGQCQLRFGIERRIDQVFLIGHELAVDIDCDLFVKDLQAEGILVAQRNHDHPTLLIPIVLVIPVKPNGLGPGEAELVGCPSAVGLQGQAPFAVGNRRVG